MLYEARGAMPIQFQALLNFLSGELDMFDALSRSLGLHVTTAYPKKGKKEVGPGTLSISLE